MNSIPSECEVAIIGAGPTGLSAGLMLQKLGVDALVLEAREQPLLTARALFVHSRTLEVLESVDITQSLVERSHRVPQLCLCASQQTLATLNFAALHAKYNFVAINPQDDTEALFNDTFTSRGGRIFRGIKVTSTKQSDGASHVLLSLENTLGQTQTLRAKYVIAADGLHSPIRTSYAIPFEGARYNLLLLTAEVRISCRDKTLLDPRQAKLYMTPKGIALFIPQPSGLWRIYTTVNSTPRDEYITKDFYQVVADEAIGKGVVIEDMTWTAHFRIAHRLAKRYREGRVFLAGDAAHVHSPAGGQGMNTGIQDGVALAKVLAEALKMGASGGDVEACLVRYEQERRPVAKGVVELTHRMTMMATLRNPVLVAVRNLVLRAIGMSPWLTGLMTRRVAQYPQLGG